MLHTSRSNRDRRRRSDRDAGYGAGYGSEYGFEWLTIGHSREWVCSQAQGRTLELGVGTGLNFRWYPDEVEVFAVDLDREHLEISADRAHELKRKIRLAVADGHRLPFSDDTFDALVSTLASVMWTTARRLWPKPSV